MNSGLIALISLTGLVGYLFMGAGSIRVWNIFLPKYREGLELIHSGGEDLDAWIAHFLFWPFWWLGMGLYFAFLMPIRWWTSLTGIFRED